MIGCKDLADAMLMLLVKLINQSFQHFHQLYLNWCQLAPEQLLHDVPNRLHYSTFPHILSHSSPVKTCAFYLRGVMLTGAHYHAQLAAKDGLTFLMGRLCAVIPMEQVEELGEFLTDGLGGCLWLCLTHVRYYQQQSRGVQELYLQIIELLSINSCVCAFDGEVRWYLGKGLSSQLNSHPSLILLPTLSLFMWLVQIMNALASIN